MRLSSYRFKLWLYEKAASGIVGRGIDPDACPIALWLNEAHNTNTARVYSDCFELNGEEHPLPAWAQAFTALVDNYHWRGGRVRADMARTYMMNFWWHERSWRRRLKEWAALQAEQGEEQKAA